MTTVNYQKFAAKLAILMDDEAWRRSMGKLGQRRIENKLAWQHFVPSRGTVYDLVARPHNRRALATKSLR
jgi:hypothetical protein